jgi:hypothetical protein
MRSGYWPGRMPDIHTSGHASVADRRTFAAAINPAILVRNEWKGLAVESG